MAWESRDADVYEEIAQALVEDRNPDFSRWRRYSDAIADMFWDWKKYWFAKFQERIAELSKDTIRLEEANPDDFSFRIRGFAHYLKLVHASGRVVKFCFTNGLEPIEYDRK